ncbi:Uncharacterised protein [uncultured Comamonas sp.]|nr:Uncharacterised protein [uncultured Comamonas sp.]
MPSPAPAYALWNAAVLAAGALAFSGTSLAAAEAAPAAVTLANVPFSPQLELHGSTLTLNGAGIRHKLMFKIYAAGIYLPQKVQSLEQANALAGPKRIRLVPLRTIDAEELSRLFLRSLEANADKAVFYRLAPAMLQISQVFSDIRKLQPGDELVMDWVPGTGTIVTHNGAVKSDTFKDREFFDALLGIWLGPRPADPALKQSLLGQPTD